MKTQLTFMLALAMALLLLPSHAQAAEPFTGTGAFSDADALKDHVAAKSVVLKGAINDEGMVLHNTNTPLFHISALRPVGGCIDDIGNPEIALIYTGDFAFALLLGTHAMGWVAWDTQQKCLVGERVTHPVPGKLVFEQELDFSEHDPDSGENPLPRHFDVPDDRFNNLIVGVDASGLQLNTETMSVEVELRAVVVESDAGETQPFLIDAGFQPDIGLKLHESKMGLLATLDYSANATGGHGIHGESHEMSVLVPFVGDGEEAVALSYASTDSYSAVYIYDRPHEDLYREKSALVRRFPSGAGHLEMVEVSYFETLESDCTLIENDADNENTGTAPAGLEDPCCVVKRKMTHTDRSWHYVGPDGDNVSLFDLSVSLDKQIDPPRCPW